jgi:hypothetical protein
MAKKENKLEQMRQKSRFAAMEAKKPVGGLPLPPRKAMSNAKKASKKLSYPLPPYPGANPVQLYRWARYEWWKLGKWQGLALPLVVLTALRTWEKEMELKEARWQQVDKIEAKQAAAEAYGAFGRFRPKKRKLFGIIPLP